jgi:regulator of sirC expression with transglutaminase-like and TPR domain
MLILELLVVRLAAASEQPSNLATAVRALIESPPAEIDFAHAKIALDRLIDPSIDSDRVGGEIDRIVATINKMLATLPKQEASTSIAKLNALRTFLYRSGWWNGERPYRYDMDDPLDQNPQHVLLTDYLASRKGNCVSMPILFAVLAERLGLEVTLSTAPSHLFVKYTDAQTGETYNLETTSGAGFTRDLWYRQNLPMRDEAVRNGVYLKTLSRQEAYAIMAIPVIDHLLRNGRFEQAIAVANIILAAYPANGLALAKKGSGFYRLIERDIIKRFPDPHDLPPDVAAYAEWLARSNREAFARAEALGWQETDGTKQGEQLQ